MASPAVIGDLRKLMLIGVKNSAHQRLVLNAVDFAAGIMSRLGPHDYGLARESSVDGRTVARAVSRFVGRDVHWTAVVSVPRGSKDLAAWWARDDAYRRTLATACQMDNVFPYTRIAKSFDKHGIADRIAKKISDLGYSANYSVNGAAAGLIWGDEQCYPGYRIWYNTIFPVLKTLCLAAALNQPQEADRIVELATVMRGVLPLGEKRSQRYSWVVLAAPDN